MEPNATQQEILLITSASFSKRTWMEKDASDDHHNADREQLEKACWNGLMKELLPEIFEKPVKGKELYLWNIIEADSFIELELREYPGTFEKFHSINPYYFLSEIDYN
jgi:hypothetical protein